MNTMTKINGTHATLNNGAVSKQIFKEPGYIAVNNGSLASTSHIRWEFSSFEELSVHQLYEALCLRESIFIVEQNVPYIDMDGKDKHCMHLMGYAEHGLVAYLRIVPLDLFERGYFSFGRVVVKANLRGTGIGREIVHRGIEHLDKIRNGHPIKISSQLYLKDFYASFGFVAEGEPYIEDRIPHIAMVRSD